MTLLTNHHDLKSLPTPAETGKNGILNQLWPSVAMTAILVVICCALYPLLVWAIAQVAFPLQANGSLIKKDGTLTTHVEEAVGSALLGQSFGDAKYFHPRPSAAGNGYDPTSSGGTNLGPLSDKLLNGATATQPATAPATQATGTTFAATTPSTDQTPAASQAAATMPGTNGGAFLETLAYDGLRLRVLHYALDNGITFKLYTVKSDGTKTEVPLKQFQDSQGNLNDIQLVDAFPHASDGADKIPLIAADFSTPIPADAVTASASGLDPHISLDNAILQAARVAKVRNIGVDQVTKLIRQYTEGPSLGILGDAGVNVLALNLALDRVAPVAASAAASASAPASSATPAPTVGAN